MPKTLTRDEAETTAVEALTLIANDPDQLGAFMAATGLDPDAVRNAAKDGAFLRGVMEYVIADEALLQRLSQESGTKPERIMQAAHALGAVWERDIP